MHAILEERWNANESLKLTHVSVDSVLVQDLTRDLNHCSLVHMLPQKSSKQGFWDFILAILNVSIHVQKLYILYNIILYIWNQLYQLQGTR